jgi:hypothetical protein
MPNHENSKDLGFLSEKNKTCRRPRPQSQKLNICAQPELVESFVCQAATKEIVRALSGRLITRTGTIAKDNMIRHFGRWPLMPAVLF